MSVSFGCRCEKKDKNNWVIVCFCHHHSHFSKNHYGLSDYSRVRCLKCGSIGHTKASYVMGLNYDLESPCNERQKLEGKK
jgi:hypothetical protein